MTGRVSILASILAWSAVAQAASESRGFFIPSGALDVIQQSGKGGASLRYYVKEPYPAEPTVAFICRRLAQHDWHPVTGKDLERYEKSSLESGWTDLPDQDGHVVSRIWSARWLDAKGNQVIYTLGYRTSPAAPGLKPVYLLVSAWYFDKDTAALFRGEMQKELERLRRSLEFR